jgi:uncharacterized protein involved in exopolysaccharide biosynthesis
MSEEKKIDLMDYLVILVKWKRFLILLLLPVMILTYLAIYFLIDEQYDSSALLIPAEDTSMGGLAGLMGNFTSNLPFDIGAGSSPEMNMYYTIIYSRTNLQKIIDKFNLYEVFELGPEIEDYKNLALLALANSITAYENEFAAYEITVRTVNPQLSADITNYIIILLNEKLIELKTEKSKNNRVFLEGRVEEIRLNLQYSEDSLVIYQQESGILSAEEQVIGLIETYTTLETQLITKQVEKSILEKIRDKNSPQLETINLEIDEFKNRLEELKKSGGPSGLIPALNTLPKQVISYFRLLREVEINSAILEFILPLYEQAKIEEKKDIPTLQIIDAAIAPVKKSYPPRTIITLVVTFAVFVTCFFFILIKENENWQRSKKLLFIRKNLFRWKNIH